MTLSHSFLMNIISEVDCSRQVLEPKSIFSKAFQVSGNLLAASVRLLFLTLSWLLQVEAGVVAWQEAGQWLAGYAEHHRQRGHWSRRPGQTKPERWASGQRGLDLPRAVSPADQLTYCRRLSVGKGTVGPENTAGVAGRDYQLRHKKGDLTPGTWFLVLF